MSCNIGSKSPGLLNRRPLSGASETPPLECLPGKSPEVPKAIQALGCHQSQLLRSAGAATAHCGWRYREIKLELSWRLPFWIAVTVLLEGAIQLEKESQQRSSLLAVTPTASNASIAGMMWLSGLRCREHSG